jgi:hypothetical protein
VRPIDRVLKCLETVRQHNDYYMASCPDPDHGQLRGDRNRSLSISEGDDGRVLLSCKAGCESRDILTVIGLEWKDLFEQHNGSSRGGGGPNPSEDREYVNTENAGCTLATYAKAKRLPVKFLESLGVGEVPNYNGHPAVRFPYLSVAGEEGCVRFRVSLDGNPKIKTRRGDKLTLYGLWRLEEAHECGYVIAVEGESDTHTLWHHAFPVVGIPGASSWRSEWSEDLDGIEKVYVPVEPDQGGEQLWERMTASPIRERLYRVTLDGFKDASELYLDDPEQFAERFTSRGQRNAYAAHRSWRPTPERWQSGSIYVRTCHR